MLFYDCLKVVLSSIALVKQGTQVLPKRIIHLALFIACKSNNYSVIQAILTAWPHSEISFDFMKNGLCQRYMETLEDCLDVHDYMSIKGSESYDHCIPSIALGIFCNILEQQKKNLEPVFSEIHIGSILFTEQSNAVAIICKLAEGLYPVNHPNYYISSSDTKAITLATPKLYCVRDKINLVLNVEISTNSTLKSLQKLLHHKLIFNTVITGISLSRLLPPSRQSEILSYFSDVHFNHICYDASLVCITQNLPRLESGGCLRLFSHQKIPLYHCYPAMFDKLLTSTIHKPFVLVLGNYENELFSLFANNSMRAIAVLPEAEYSYSKLLHSSEGLRSVLCNNSNTLEYVQLHKFPTSLVGVLNIHALSNLRVLSVTSRTSKGQGLSSPIINMCKLLEQLNLLEFMEWGDVINIFLKDLIMIHGTLKAHLPKLIHWHMHSFKLVLFTLLSDAERSVAGDLHTCLMKNKTGDETCSTYMLPLDTHLMKNWLQQARPNICINLKRSTKVND